ncbi:MAG TPA: adenylate/guanylate cyclase domain-containing protein, partial [Candidatus Ozemobacteraceae bacterium]|nr:adenylate/guanylate cyclase domain-containing protein [Candidatus Ozemobacteraceae bacterium]
QSRYLAAFTRIPSNQKWRDAIQRDGVKAPALDEMMMREFSSASPSLPLSALFLFDMAGNELATYSATLTPEQIDGLHKYFRIYLINTLRKRYEITHRMPPPGKNPLSDRDIAFWEAFNQVSYTNMMQLAELRRSVPDFIRAGNSWMVKLHDFIQIGNSQQIAFLIAWHDRLLDKEIIRNAMIEFTRMNPDGEFMAYRKERDRLIPLMPVSRAQRLILEQPAFAAMRRGGAYTARTSGPDDWFILARPSGTMRDIWLAAGTPITSELADFEARRNRLLMLLWLSLSMVILLGAVTAYRVVPSIVSVRSGLATIAAGNLDVTVKLDRPDELGILTQAFDEMTKGLRQRQRLSTLVSGVALQAISGGTTAAPRRGPGVVLVSDIRSFTTLCENQPAAMITGMLNKHFEVMADIIHLHGGRVDRFIGDAIQAVFEPTGQADPGLNERAVKAGLDMLMGLKTINAERRKTGLFTYLMGVGLSSGNLLFGGIGDPELRFEITMLGDAVAAATGLESLAKFAPGIPLVMAPNLVESGGIFSDSVVPLAGHESCAAVFKAKLDLE